MQIGQLELQVFLSNEDDQPLGICVFHDQGGTVVELEEFLQESLIDMSSIMRQRYACAFDIMAKQMRRG